MMWADRIGIGSAALVLIGAGVVLALDPTAQEQKKLTDEYEADVARSPGGRSPALQ
jgi:hypothetical protein